MTKLRRITVRGIIFDGDKLLAQQLKPSSDGKTRDYWCTPGGGLEPGESLLAGLRREMIEETGIAPKIGDLLFIQQYEDEVREFIEFFFHVKNYKDYTEINLAETSHGTIEVERVEFIEPSKHELLPAFLQTADIPTILLHPHPVMIADYLN